MAITKAKLIADGVITVGNLHESHGITTTHIGEGDKLFYTDTRVSNYLSANNYITTSDVPNLETVTSLSISANILSYTNEAGVTTDVDLSTYLDDTNLARLVSGTLNPGTGIATFTRDDSSTFTIDFSAFLADANDYVSSGSFNTSTGVLTLTRLGGGTVTVDLDGKYAEASHTHLWSHITDRPTALSAFTNDLGNYGGFLTSFTETDPVYTASSWYTTINNSSNWNTAYGWGNHATVGYLTSFTETDPTVPSHVKSITSTNISNWNTAYGWGNHANAGYQAAATAITTSNIGSQIVNQADRLRAYSAGATPQSANSFGLGVLSNYYGGGQITDIPEGAYGSLYNFGGYDASSLSMQMFLGVNHNSTSSTRSLFFRMGNNLGFQNDWKQVIDSSNIGSQSVNYAASAGTATDSSKLPLTGGTLSGTLILGSTASAGSSAILNTNGFIRVAEHVIIHNPSNLAMAQGISWDSSTNGLYTYNESSTGTLRATGSMRAPIFYDSDDTGYYVDPNSESKLRKLWINNGGANGVSWSSGLNMGDASNYWNLIQDAGTARQRNFGTGGYDWYNNSASTQIMLLSNGGDLTTSSSMRAPIFYDTNNTAHYIDPSGGSNIRNLYVGDPGDSWSDPGGWGTQVRFSNGPHVRFVLHARTPEIQAGMYVHTPSSVFIGSYTAHPVNMMVGGNSRLLIEDSRVYSHVYSEAAGSSRAPIFYDSNDTGYYLNPAGNSVLTTATFNVNASSTLSIIAGGTNATVIRAAAGDELYIGGNDSWQMRFNGGNVLMDNGGYLQNNTSIRAPIFYDANNTGYYVDPNNTSNLSTLNIEASNSIVMYKSQTVNMSGAEYSTSNYYPVIISVPVDGVLIEIQNNLNSNIPSWSGHGGGFTLNLRWWVNGSGWGTTDIKRKVYQWHERFANLRICGGITQMYTSSQEVVYLRGGGVYYFRFSKNLNATPYSSNYTNSYNNEVANVTSSPINSVWEAAAGNEAYYAEDIYTSNIQSYVYYDRNSTSYYLDASSTGDSLRVAGDVVAYYSDERLKNIECNIPDAIEKVKSLNGFYYTANETAQKLGYKEGRQVGLSAQEVEAIMPEVVKEAAIGKGYKTLDYSKIIPLLVEAIKEQQKQIDELKAIINGTT